MSTISLLLLVFVLGLRHGLDADHLACIDGLTRYNIRQGRRTARYVGTLFSFGHGFVVATVGVILAMISQNFVFPAYFDSIATWVSICSLFAIGCLNVFNLLRSQRNQTDYKPQGIKGRFIPRFARETTNPFLIILIGGIFALAADTVSQTSLWALAAGNASQFLPILLGLTFMIGMMITDTIDSLVAYRLLTNSSKMGQSASRVMGWIIVVLAFGVSLYELFLFFYPDFEIDFEVVGAGVFGLVLLIFFSVLLFNKKQAEKVINA